MDRTGVRLSGRMVSVKRMALVVAVMVVGISLMLWAGWHNLRERRLAMQRAQESHVALTPDKGGQGGDSAADSGPTLEGSTLAGKAAPAFTLKTLDGKKVSLSDYKGKAVLVNFWATWCAPCKIEMPWFEEFEKQYASQGLVILGVVDDVDAGKDMIAKTAQKAGVTYPILLSDGKVGDAYSGVDAKGQPVGMEYLPMSFYVDKNGVVVAETAGLAAKSTKDESDELKNAKNEIEKLIKKTIASGGPGGGVTVGGSAAVKVSVGTAELALSMPGVR
jgi:thiol-disulfide isomerase/thioredoxin